MTDDKASGHRIKTGSGKEFGIVCINDPTDCPQFPEGHEICCDNDCCQHKPWVFASFTSSTWTCDSTCKNGIGSPGPGRK